MRNSSSTGLLSDDESLANRTVSRSTQLGTSAHGAMRIAWTDGFGSKNRHGQRRNCGPRSIGDYALDDTCRLL